MITQTIKKRGLKRILNLLSNLSDENLIRAIDIGKKIFIKDEIARSYAEGIRKAFQKKHPSIELTRNILKKLSKSSKDKLIENFFINATILGNQKRKKLEEKYGFGLPWFFVISPTAKCNLNCIGCYAGEYIKDKGLSFEEVDRILSEAKELGIYFITISGGEPFVWPHLSEMLEKHNDMYF